MSPDFLINYMDYITDEYGNPIHDYPEKMTSKRNDYMNHMKFLVQRQYFEGTPISRDDHKDLLTILDIPKDLN